MRTDYLEIEHKYLVQEDFDLDRFAEVLRELGATGPKKIQVRDTYFHRRGVDQAIFRHRIDAELHQLTVKSRPEDAEIRREVNLDLAGPDAVEAVAAFLAAGWGTCEVVPLVKELAVWELPGCEVVHYTARRSDGFAVRCVEFESTAPCSPAEAVDVLERVGRACGFEPAGRTPHSLFYLMTAADGTL